MENDTTKKDTSVIEPDQIVLVGKTSGRELKLKNTIDDKGVVFYEAAIDWRNDSAALK